MGGEASTTRGKKTSGACRHFAPVLGVSGQSREESSRERLFSFPLLLSFISAVGRSEAVTETPAGGSEGI